MSDNRPEPARGPPEHHLFDDMCGPPPSTSEFAEWTPSDLWFPSYQDLLQDETAAAPPPGSAQANAEASLPDRSHSSHASATGMMLRFLCHLSVALAQSKPMQAQKKGMGKLA